MSLILGKRIKATVEGAKCVRPFWRKMQAEHRGNVWIEKRLPDGRKYGANRMQKVIAVAGKRRIEKVNPAIIRSPDLIR